MYETYRLRLRMHTANPTEPSPNIATVDPGSTFAVLHAAPNPKTRFVIKFWLDDHVACEPQKDGICKHN